ncbi:unnamed protein product [Calicophoron daubneyi]|uniref:Secreted protein n=1 Tax=Calicophoron daubneyi TaxID=300641 RepID=A0AAV2T388_CALDB
MEIWIRSFNTVYCILFCYISLLWVLSVARTNPSCPLANPPLDLGSGALDHLIDVILSKLFNSTSSIHFETVIKPVEGWEFRDIKVYNLQSIHRTCAVRLTTRDIVGCHQRGLILELCGGFEKLLVNATLKTTIPGMKNGAYQITIHKTSVKLIVELFSPSTGLNDDQLGAFQFPVFYQLARVIELRTTTWRGIRLKPLTGNFCRRIISWLVAKFLNLASRSLRAHLDLEMRRILNELLKKLSMEPLFMPLKIGESSKLNPPTQARPSINTPTGVRNPTRVLVLPIG